MAEKKETVRFEDINIEDLLERVEDEGFDRTVGGQDPMGRKIAGFGTKNGGLLLVGQEDFKRGGKLAGINEREFQEHYRNAMSGIRPQPLMRQRIVRHKGLAFALIQVHDVGALKPCAYLNEYYERKGDSNVRLQPEEIRRYHLLFGATNAEDMPTHATKEQIDEAEIREYVKLLKKSPENIEGSVTSNDGHLTVRGVVILAQKPDEYLEGMFVEIQRYDNFWGSPPVPIGAAVKLSKPARQLIEETSKVVEQNLPVVREYRGAKMFESPAIPSSVIREVITNSIAHRNYRSHEHIRIRLFSDGFDVSNPAVITEKMWLEILEAKTPYHPNEGIYTFLNPALLYEGRGEGIWKIREEMGRLGKTAPEFKVIGEAPSNFYVKISLNRGKAQDLKRQKLSRLISKRRELTTTEVMKHLNVSRVTSLKLLSEAVKAGLLEHEGNTKTSKYIVRNKGSALPDD